MLRDRVPSLVIVLGMATLVVAIIVVISFVFEFLTISGPSMSPVLIQGDHILVNKLAYKSQKPQEGDIIAFRSGWRTVVKRVIGLPGDVIEVKDGIFYRNGRAIASVALYSHSLRRRRMTCKVSGRHVFVMGDNRDLSMDSRNYGAILYDDIIGKAILIYFPLNRIGRLK